MHASVRLGAFGCFLRIRACLIASSLGCCICRYQRKKPEPKSGTKNFNVQKKNLELEYFNEIRYEYSLEPYR